MLVRQQWGAWWAVGHGCVRGAPSCPEGGCSSSVGVRRLGRPAVSGCWGAGLPGPGASWGSQGGHPRAMEITAEGLGWG